MGLYAVFKAQVRFGFGKDRVEIYMCLEFGLTFDLAHDLFVIAGAVLMILPLLFGVKLPYHGV